MKTKTNGLTGADLDWAVAKAEGAPGQYSTDWAQGGPIIEREITKLFRNLGGTFTAQIRHAGISEVTGRTILLGWTTAAGPTPLVAAMRCYVASKLGDEVDVPND